MKACKLSAFFTFIFIFSVKSFSQFYYDDRPIYVEFGAGLGSMNCITDIGGANSDKALYINEIRPGNFKFSNSIYAALMFKDFMGLRLEGTWGQVSSSDALITSTSSLNLITKNLRNLSFRSDITEVALLLEFHPLDIKYRPEGPPKFSPYLLAGFGRFTFNPQTNYNGQYVNLQPLSIEGQGFPEFPNRKPYKLTQTNIPLGIGVRYELSSQFCIRLEYLHRKLFTDYLDNASSRKNIDPALYAKYLSPVEASLASALANPSKDGKNPPRRSNPDNNDSYMTFSLRLGIAIGRSYAK